MYRIKTLFGRELRARNFENQAAEAFLKCCALNKMTELGMPESYKTLMQRGFYRLTQEIGTPAGAPKQRGSPPGRQKGQYQPKRERYSIIIKSKKTPKKAAV